jgi:hypothetical protein
MPVRRGKILQQGDGGEEEGVVSQCGKKLCRENDVEAAIHSGLVLAKGGERL